MAGSTKEIRSRLLTEIKQLPASLLAEVADFIEFLKYKNQEDLDPEDEAFLRERWREALDEEAKGRTIPADEVFAKVRASRKRSGR
jgi:hypothetical protein